MILLLGAIGWGLFVAGAGTHLMHRSRLEELLRSHVRAARPASMFVVAFESLLAIALPLTFFAGWVSARQGLAVAAVLAGVGFTLWVSRLVVSKSSLPCACSFSSAPPTWWSVLRSAATMLAGLFVLNGVAATDRALSNDVATLLTGAALGVALYVLPDALTWPHWATEMKRMGAAGDTVARLTRVEISPGPAQQAEQ